MQSKDVAEVLRFAKSFADTRDFRKRSLSSNVKLKIDFSCVVIAARVRIRRPLCLIFRRNATRAKLIRHASTAHSSESARGYLPRFYLPRGADRQKRQIASCRFAEYAFRFSIATRLSACESMNREQIYPRIDSRSRCCAGALQRAAVYITLFSLFLCNIYYCNRCHYRKYVKITYLNIDDIKWELLTIKYSEIVANSLIINSS